MPKDTVQLLDGVDSDLHLVRQCEQYVEVIA